MIICIVGPTGVGKSKLALSLAKRLNGEIVNGDAFQIYKEMDIGTAKATNIISYRNQNGFFISIADIKNVKGIGDDLFNKIKEYICV